jgi:quercetin dioxygenase-like cupin family protein
MAAAVLGTMITVPAMAQDPTKVDAKHYKVEFENDQVRVLRITYGPKEKSIMHEHPGAVAVFMTDGKVKFGLPDGKVIDNDVKAGKVQWTPAGKHLPENVGDKPFEVVLVEMKGKPAAKPEAKPEAKPDAKAAAKPDAKPAAK